MVEFLLSLPKWQAFGLAFLLVVVWTFIGMLYTQVMYIAWCRRNPFNAWYPKESYDAITAKAELYEQASPRGYKFPIILFWPILAALHLVVDPVLTATYDFLLKPLFSTLDRTATKTAFLLTKFFLLTKLT